LLRVTEINSFSEFLEMQDYWNKVLGKCHDNNVFLTWENTFSNARLLEKGERLKILLVTDENKIVSIAPFKQSPYSLGGFLSYDVIAPLAYRTSDYTGIILAERELECLRLMLHYLFKQNDWDFIYLYDVPETSIILSLLPQIQPDFKFEINPGTICPYLSIPNSEEKLMKNLSAKFRKNLRRSMKKLQEDYGKVELKTNEEVGSLEDATDLFFNLHQQRWKRKGQKGVFASQKDRESTLSLARLFAEKGWLALYFLTVDDKPVAAQYCLQYNRRMYYWLGGFDPTYSPYSVGSLITLKVIEQCIINEIIEYDFMKGDEQYKFNWSTDFRRNMNIKFVNNKLTSKLINFGVASTKKLKIDDKLGKFMDF
jgi:CelD/BcsL family acetyltransferase involved in cellulose biosynthesis